MSFNLIRTCAVKAKVSDRVVFLPNLAVQTLLYSGSLGVQLRKSYR